MPDLSLLGVATAQAECCDYGRWPRCGISSPARASGPRRASDTGRNVSGDALLLAPLTLYLSCTRAWPITARYLDADAYQPRWDRFIGEPSSWWEEHVDELTERLPNLHRRARPSGILGT